MLQRLFDRICVKLIKSRAGDTHFRRWQILKTPWFSVYVHCISKSDEDRDPHDHPWWFVSLMLAGGYLEERLQNGIWTGQGNFPGSVIFRKTTDFHKITLLDKDAWTLVLVGPKRHFWGYMTDKGWVDHVTYRRRKHANVP